MTSTKRVRGEGQAVAHVAKAMGHLPSARPSVLAGFDAQGDAGIGGEAASEADHAGAVIGPIPL